MGKENVAALFNGAVLPEMLVLTAGVPNWFVFEYCTHYVQMLHARRFLRMFSERRSSTMVDRRGMHHNLDIGAWERRWSALLSWCTGIISLAGLFDMLFVRYVDEVAYRFYLHELFRKHRKKSTDEEGID